MYDANQIINNSKYCNLTLSPLLQFRYQLVMSVLTFKHIIYINVSVKPRSSKLYIQRPINW